MKTTSALFILSILLSCNPSPGDRKNVCASTRQEVEAAIRGCIEWAATKDTSRLYSIILQDSSYLEVEPPYQIISSGEIRTRNGEYKWLSFMRIRWSSS